MFNYPDLSGRVAIVTGASRGVGKVVATSLAKAGCDVCVAAKSLESKPELPGSIIETRDEVIGLGRRSIAVQTDVRFEEQIASMVNETVEQLGRVDILVNNAGALWWKNLEDTPANRFDLVMGVNARASFLTAQYCLPHMRKNSWGHIINMSPPVELGMVPGKIAYCISKFGMTLVAHGLATELKGQNIAANALWPATVIESQASINFGLGGPKYWRKPEILADAVMAIVSHEPETFSGQALIDEQVLDQMGVKDFSSYLCEPGGEPIRIVGDSAVAAGFGTGAGGRDKAKS